MLPSPVSITYILLKIETCGVEVKKLTSFMSALEMLFISLDTLKPNPFSDLGVKYFNKINTEAKSLCASFPSQWAQTDM